MKKYIHIVSLLCALFISSYAFAKERKITLVTSIAPQGYLLKHIVGDTARVVVFLPKGSDPHTFEPSAKIIQQISTAQIFFTIGVGLEKQWKAKLQGIAPNMEFIPSYVVRSALYSLRPEQPVENAHNHHHDTHDDHSPLFEEDAHGNFIPVNQHIWTSPLAVYNMVERMRDILVEKYPDNKELYIQNTAKLVKKIERVDSEIRVALEKKQYRTFISYHPSWGYFANEYRLKELVVEENEREPSAKAMAMLISNAKKEKVRVILSQPQFPKKSVITIAKDLNNIPIVDIDPLQENWFTTMEEMKKILERYL